MSDGTLSGIIDWGDITSGDAATDLASIWMLFPDPCARAAALETYASASEALVTRAKGWAVYFGVMFLSTGIVDHARHARLGQRILDQASKGM